MSGNPKFPSFLSQATNPASSLRSKTHIVENKRWDPLTAGAASTLGTITNFTSALGGTFVDPFIQMKRVHDTGASGSSMTTTALTTAGVGLTGIGTSVVKGTLVNVPLALAEGFRNTPALYGDKVRDLGPVTDWKSGGVVAAKVRSSEFKLALKCFFEPFIVHCAANSPIHRTLASASTRESPA